MTQTNEIDKKYSYGRIWKIAYPILISLVMEQLLFSAELERLKLGLLPWPEFTIW